MRTTINEQIVEGIILKNTSYKDHDMILHVYTKEYGKIGIHARGVKKLTSKNARATQDMMKSELSIYVKKGLSSLIKATPIHYYRDIKESIESEIVGQYILEYYYRCVQENDPSLEDYHVLEMSLKYLDEGYIPLYVYLLFNVYILQTNGIIFDVDGCVKCSSHQVASISLQDGGFLCYEHALGHKMYPVSLLKSFRHIQLLSIDQIQQLHIEEDDLKTLVSMIDYCIDEYVGISLKTKIFMKQIF